MFKADQTAADRLLKAAVRRAREQIAAVSTRPRVTLDRGSARFEWPRDYDRTAVVAMLTAAGESAALLLDGAE